MQDQWELPLSSWEIDVSIGQKIGVPWNGGRERGREIVEVRPLSAGFGMGLVFAVEARAIDTIGHDGRPVGFGRYCWRWWW